AERADVAGPADCAQQHGQAGVAGQRIALLLGLGLEGETADAEAVVADLVFGADAGRPALRAGRLAGTRAKHQQAQRRRGETRPQSSEMAWIFLGNGGCERYALHDMASARTTITRHTKHTQHTR